MLLAVLSSFVVALGFAVAGKYLNGRIAHLTFLLPLSLFLYFIQFGSEIIADSPILYHYSWIPTAGVNLDFRLDGLSYLFTLLITGIGTLVFIYGSQYMKGHKHINRFFGYLTLFMGAMLGLVLSDNLITLFLFWEITSISSFFLIGFNYSVKAARKAALLSLAITSIGGLLLLVGFIIMGNLTDSYQITEILHSGDTLIQSGFGVAIMVLMFFGAFTKSAQFPFHFWLPQAMQAPTPVSTYLHSATMVKAGIYLLARFSPVFNGNDFWHYTLISIGSITMIYAAIHALQRTDLKAILAYTTISALGIMVALIGVGSREALMAAALFILVHAIYKAAFFLIAGIIDHHSGTRDVTQLSGLRKIMPLVFIAGILAAISNAGILPALGYHSKHLLYESVLNFPTAGWILLGLFMLVNIIIGCAGYITGLRPFLGKGSSVPSQNTHKISALMWGPPLLLGAIGVIFGLFPHILEAQILGPISQTLNLGVWNPHLHLWSGFDILFISSAVTILLGIGLYLIFTPRHHYLEQLSKVEKFSPGAMLALLSRQLRSIFYFLTHLLQNGYLRYYTGVIIAFLIILMTIRMYNGLDLKLAFHEINELTINEYVTLSVMLISVVIAVVSKSRLLAIASLGALGLSICLLFVYYSAPDLAMTQFTIDTLTVVLFVLLLRNLPAYLPKIDRGPNWRDIIISVAFGTLIFLFAMEVVSIQGSREINSFYAENAYILAKGKNVVNVILVDFRGVDTLIEITVLAVAGLGVFSLIKLNMSDPPD